MLGDMAPFCMAGNIYFVGTHKASSHMIDTADQLCPKGSEVTPERVRAWHKAGFNVRAWGIDSTETMKKVYDSGANGMTVNFPDKLTAYISERG